ncbi:hypothetical protein D3C87_1117570 [compost metagenome]
MRLADAAIEGNERVFQNRSAGFEHAPAPGGETFFHRRLAAEQGAQRLVLRGKRVDADDAVALHHPVGGSIAIEADEQGRRIVGNAANGRRCKTRTSSHTVRGDDVDRRTEPRHGVSVFEAALLSSLRLHFRFLFKRHHPHLTHPSLTGHQASTQASSKPRRGRRPKSLDGSP